MLLEGRILIIRGDMPLQLTPELIHRVSLRTWLWQPDQRNVEVGSEALTLGGAMPRRLVQQQRDRAPRIRLAHETEEGLEVRLLHVRATPEDPMPGTEIDGTKQDAFGVTPRNRDMRLFALQSPGTPQDGKEAQHCLILPEEHGVGWELPEPADYCPFFCARCGAFSA